MESITPAQEIYLTLIEAGGKWNSFDGKKIATDLRTHLHVWRSALVTRVPAIPSKDAPADELKYRADLIVLRDLPEDHINLDTMFIIPEAGQQELLEELVRSWLPDEISWYSRREGLKALGASKFRFAGFPDDEPQFILRIWWD